ncbi:hypothetical protein SAMN02745172_02475 [Pseudoxanthobacter soli DSM 19599]|uniref:Prophage minor tail protein Z (GPZ) n=1 Tax=Pseudoxanthobacter soli DSM 19599 TaxID=1123029 RepID=A0A1M7ZLQ1_9HYPH|nr:hypothetical protein [Pseudoxanthobacter soli]SHO65828.1 hypothetical protein SAMN02745172_02475 [Pseudoxanthobacter soli DSM 19599]
MVAIGFRVDVGQYVRLGNRMAAVGDKLPLAVYRAVRHTGDQTLTQVRRALVSQTGARYGAVRRVTSGRAEYGAGRYVIRAADRTLPLRDFGARQVKTGISAAPWKVRRRFPHMFMVSSLGGHVFVRVGGKRKASKGSYAGQMRQRITKRWGPAIPKEMVKGASEAAFFATVQAVLPRRLDHELVRLLT